MAVLIYDDTDPAIQYADGDWSRAGVSQEFNSTTTGTDVEGATATMQFSGTQISVHGTIASGSRSSGARSSYVIDDESPVVFQARPGAAVQYNQLFFRSPALSPGEHTLTITNLDGDDRDMFFLDLLIVTPLETPPVTTTTTTVTQSASTVPGRPTTVTVTAPNPNPSGDSAAAGSQTGAASSGNNTGAIAGGIIGGIAALLLLAGAFFFFRKRNQKKKPDDSYWASPSFNNNGAQGSVIPFTAPPSVPPQSAQALFAQPQYAQQPQTTQTQASFDPYLMTRTPGDQFRSPNYPESVAAYSVTSPSELAYYTQSDYSQYPTATNTQTANPMVQSGPPVPVARTRVNLNDNAF